MFSHFLHHTDLGRTTAEIADLLQHAGGQAMLVGGTVRDLLRNRRENSGAEAVNDVDIEVYGLYPEQIQQALTPRFSTSQVGASFAVLKLKHYNIDLSLPRSERKIAPGHRGFQVSVKPDMSFADAAARRDLTINAIMYDLHAHEIVDPCNGQHDLDKKILRHVNERFREDNLRVLRVMQFAARFDFDVAPETVACCQAMSQDDLPRERLMAEWEKLLLHGIKPARGLQFLRDCGWLRYYPELVTLSNWQCPQNRHWQYEDDAWSHTLRALDLLPERRTGQKNDDLTLSLALLCQHFQKEEMSTTQQKRNSTAEEFDWPGQKLLESFVRRLWQQTWLLEKISRLLACQARIANMIEDKISDQAIQRLAVDAKRIDLLHILAECDFMATMPAEPQPTLRKLRQLLQHAQELGIAQEAPKPIIMGRHLQAMGLTPGKKFQEILQLCYQAQLTGQFHDRTEANSWLQNNLPKLKL